MGLPLAALAALSLFGLGAENQNFDNVVPPSLPPGWTQTLSGRGPAPNWETVRDGSAPSRPNVLVQSSTASGPGSFPIAIFNLLVCRDADLSVKFRIEPSSGRIRTAGIVWRYQDERNYYLIHFSVEQQNIVLFRVENGRPRPIPIMGSKPGSVGISHELKTGQWYVAKITVRGARIRVLFGNRMLFEAEDDSLPSPGKTGLWTRGGTVVRFDDFRVDKNG